jgi:hypothetical protein
MTYTKYELFGAFAMCFIMLFRGFIILLVVRGTQKQRLCIHIRPAVYIYVYNTNY